MPKGLIADNSACDAFFENHKPTPLKPPGGLIKGISENNTHFSSLNPNHKITWSLEIDFRLQPSSSPPVRQGDVLVYKVPGARGHIKFSGTATDLTPNFHRTLQFRREVELEIDRAEVQYVRAPSLREVIFVNIPVPRINHGDGMPEVYSIRFRDEPTDPFPNVFVSVDFLPSWQLDGTYHIPGSAQWVQNYLLWMTGAGRATDKEVDDRRNSLTFNTSATEVVVFRPTGITLPLAGYVGSLGYRSADIAGIRSFIDKLISCGVKSTNVHVLASSAAVAPFESQLYKNLPTELGAVLLAQPFCPKLTGSLINIVKLIWPQLALIAESLRPICETQRLIPGTAKQALYGVYDIIDNKINDPRNDALRTLGEALGAGERRFAIASPDREVINTLLHFENGCEETNIVNVTDRHISALGLSETLAGDVLTHVTAAELGEAKQLLADQQRLRGGIALPCKFVAVPYVIGKDRSAAELIIRGVPGLVVGGAGHYNVATVAADIVFAQLPPAHKRVVEGTAVHLLVSTGSGIFGDLNGDGEMSCLDMLVIKESYKKRTGQGGFDLRADINRDGIVDINDASIVSQRLPAGANCPK
jgi:hypothetical protein